MIIFAANFKPYLNFLMHTLQKSFFGTVIIFIVVAVFSSCISTRKIAYFSDIKDSANIVSPAGLEPVIQKKDILSIAVSSLSPEATELFNMPNIPVTPNALSSGTAPQTAGYLVNDEGLIKFPMLGKLPVAGLTQKQLEDSIAHKLVEKKLLYDPIITVRFLNFRVTVLGEVDHPGVVYAPNEQMSILEAIGQAGDLTIFGLRDNVILIRQDGNEKLVKRLDLNSSKILQSPYYFLKSNDVIYVEPGKAKIATTDNTRQNLPIIFGGITAFAVLVNLILNLK